jgi:hypothetical protein
MAGVEKVAVICPSCRLPTKTGFEVDIEAFRTNLLGPTLKTTKPSVQVVASGSSGANQN